MQKEKHEGYIKKDTMYLVIGVSLLVGFLSGVMFTVYKSPAGNDSKVEQASQGPDLTVMEKQVADTPDDPDAWIHLGHAYFDADQYAKAINAYNKSLQLAPDNPDVLTDLGVMYRRNGQSDQALTAFDQAIKAAPYHEQSRFNKGVVLMFDKNDQAGAFKVWQELLAINPRVTAPNGQSLADFMVEMEKKNNQ